MGSLDDLISVIVPVFNEEPSTLSESFESLSAQTHDNFECLVVDESTDVARAAFCAELCGRDSRFRYLRPGTRLGVAGSLNFALEQARGAFIARADGDDINRPDRLETQIAFLRDHPDISVVGSSLTLIDAQGRVLGHRPYPLSPRAVARAMHMTCAVAHPSVMIRADVLRAAGGYDPAFRNSEDLNLWLGLLNRGVKFANLEAPLVSYRRPEMDRDGRHWRHNLKARLRNFSSRHMVRRLLGIVVIGLWAYAPGGLRRAVYRQVVIRRRRG